MFVFNKNFRGTVILRKVSPVFCWAILFSCLAGIVNFFPAFAFAGVFISEVMYDISEPGVDAGREWIKIKNSDDVPVEISGLKFFENETNHNLVFFSGNRTLGKDECVIVSNDPQKFLVDNPSYIGNIFRASFSLNNSGEVLALKSQSKIIDSISYTKEDGGRGDGNSLHRYSIAKWQFGKPTPGSCAESVSSLQRVTSPVVLSTPPASQSSDSISKPVAKETSKRTENIPPAISNSNPTNKITTKSKIVATPKVASVSADEGQTKEATGTSTNLIYTSAMINSGSNLDWYLALIGLAGVATLGVVFSFRSAKIAKLTDGGLATGRGNSAIKDESLNADDFEIIEINDDEK